MATSFGEPGANDTARRLIRGWHRGGRRTPALAARVCWRARLSSLSLQKARYILSALPSSFCGQRYLGRRSLRSRTVSRLELAPEHGAAGKWSPGPVN